jgi:WD40-like Beta Propeller Repeat
MSYTPDGGDLLYDAFGEERERGIWLLPTAKKGLPRRLIGGTNSREPMVSPDGHWLAYTSGESGTLEIYVQKYPDLGRKQQISAGGGRSPLWSRDGGEIFYRKGDGLYAVAFESGAEPKIGAPHLLFEKAGIRGYDVAPDGKGFFAVLQPADSGIVKELHLVTNWFQELNQLAPPARK